MKQSHKTLLLWLVLIALFIAIYAIFQQPADPLRSFEELAGDADEGLLAAVRVVPHDDQASADVTMVSGHRYRTTQVGVPLLIDTLTAARVPYTIAAPSATIGWTTIVTWIPALVVILIFVLWMRALRGKSGTNVDALRGSDLAPLEVKDAPAIEGLDDARGRLSAAAAAVRNGQPGPRRILLSGPPGSGKTALLRWLARDSTLPLYAVTGSWFSEIFVGIGAARMRTLFKAAAARPSIAAIEDVDAFGVLRVLSDEKNHPDELRSTLIELCNHLDGLTPFPASVLFIATSNRRDLLDPALVRPGRFDLEIELDLNRGSSCRDQTPTSSAAHR